MKLNLFPKDCYSAFQSAPDMIKIANWIQSLYISPYSFNYYFWSLNLFHALRKRSESEYLHLDALHSVLENPRIFNKSNSQKLSQYIDKDCCILIHRAFTSRSLMEGWSNWSIKLTVIIFGLNLAMMHNYRCLPSFHDTISNLFWGTQNNVSHSTVIPIAESDLYVGTRGIVSTTK